MSMEQLASENTNPVHRGLERARQELLDLGLRNSLISYRPLRARGAEVIGASPQDVFATLVRESKRLTFDAAQDDDASDALTPPASVEHAARRKDLRLQTPYPSAQLQSRLLATYYAARTFIEEQGVNVLFLALGMLEWYEADSSQEPRRAPLVLVPVELERSNAMDRFHLVYTGEEIGDNLSIVAKVKAEFGVELPVMPDSDDLELESYFSGTEEAIAFMPRWRVDRDAVALGFFSFGKFLMYRDLDVSVWPEDAQPTSHPIIQSLLADGFREPASTIGEDVFIDPLLNDAETFQVVDADSSQTVTIVDVLQGRNLVVQGPPGTGKSQTITNVIAEAIGAGKTVLFVAEKMAALEVVKRRLDQVGLGDACLELHSHRINKRSVLQELQRTLDLGRPRLDRLEDELRTLRETRTRLNDYCDAINTPVGESGRSPYEIYGELVRLKRIPGEAEWPRVEIDGIANWTGEEQSRLRGIVGEMRSRLEATGIPAEHPFWGIRKTLLLPTEEPRLRTALDDAWARLNGLGELAARSAGELGVDLAPSLASVEALIALLDRASEAPQATGIDMTSAAWASESDRLDHLIQSGKRRAEILERRRTTLKPEIWERPLRPLLESLISFRSKWWRALSGSYRSARAELDGYCAGDAPASIEEQIALVEDVLEAQRLAEVVRQHRELGQSLFGPYWRGVGSDWVEIEGWSAWLTALHRDIQTGRVPAALSVYVQSHPDRSEARQLSESLSTALADYLRDIQSLQVAAEFDPEVRFGTGSTLEDQPLATQYGLLRAWIDRFDSINGITSLNVSKELCDQNGLSAMFDLACSWPKAAAHLEHVFLRACYEALLDRALVERPALARFDGDAHQYVIERFRELDTLTFEHNRARLAHQHWARVPRGEGGGQLAVLRREFEKKSRHLPIRRLVERAGNAIQAIKPVFMMSPLSIATYIPPATVSFDLVIFDEASQVKPVDAFGALIRGRQAVVVGDSKQLPPTSFFDTLTHTDELDEEDDVTSDIESILGLFAASNAPQRMLRWHYRSRHESLITVSNYEFYDNRLVLFPSPDASREDSGLVMRHLPHTSYDRGNTRTNPEEAAEVARAVMEHARRTPELTLGVAAFSKAQTEALLYQVELLRRQDPSCEAFFSAHPFEPFFVKNLENVQGDERDVVFISVGYGRTAEGYVAMGFGPLNNNGGERRLNVLITRARRRCEVFTNLTSDDIRVGGGSPRGLLAFKRFLKYAETGILDVPRETGADFDSPFEAAVYDELTRLGYEVHRQVGSAGFFIDLAVVDPRKPGRYLLAIECDGATYHSARSARDRDRLRQQVLENLGWQVHRIWSTDWFRNRDREIRRVADVIEQALAREPVTTLPVSEIIETSIEREDEHPGEAMDFSTPYGIAPLSAGAHGRDLHLVPARDLAEWVALVVRYESPVHRSEVARRIADVNGVSRVGSRIRAAIDAAIRLAASRKAIVERGDFLWDPSTQTPTIRDRGNLPNASRSMDLIAPEEVDQAVLDVVRRSFGIDVPDVAPVVCRLFGFQRATDGMQSVVHERIEELVSSGALEQVGLHLTVTTGSDQIG